MMEGHDLKDYARNGTAHACHMQQKVRTCPEQHETGKCNKKKRNTFIRKVLSLFKSCHHGEDKSSNRTKVSQESVFPLSPEDHGKHDLLTNASSEKLLDKYILSHLEEETAITFRMRDILGKKPPMNQIERDQVEIRSGENPTPSRPCTVADTSESQDETKVMKLLNANTSNSVYTIGKNKEGYFVRAITPHSTVCNSMQNQTEISNELVSDLKTAVDHYNLDRLRTKRVANDPNEGMPVAKDRPAQMYQYPSRSSLIRNLCNFNHFHRYPTCTPVFMTEGNVFCYPTYTDIAKRKDSLKNCTSQQLKQYHFEELARTGWFFNQRALITFCCGMEMPMMPNGQPLNVHLSLSPQCEFAHSIPAHATYSDMAAAGADEGNLEASGGVAEFTFSAPIQATNDGSGHVYYASEWNEELSTFSSENLAEDSHYALPSATSTYLQSVVTNTTQLPSENLSGDSDTAQQRPAGRDQRSADDGQLRMRGNFQNPLGNARMRREFEGDAGQQNYILPFAVDQINLDGERGDGYRARYPQFGFPAIRSMTYDGWPTTHTQTPEMMAEAGFIYAGYGDSLLCYSCGIGVRHWRESDDPWIEHARWRPSCVFLQVMKGQEFIDVVRDLCRRSGSNRSRPSMQDVTTELNRRAAARGDGGST